jgi:thymidylate synthase
MQSIHSGQKFSNTELPTNPNEETYLNLLRDVLDNGVDRPDRTGVGVRSVFGRMARYDLSYFPILTTKKMEIKSIISELLWFIEGSGDERRLAEIRYGKDRSLLSDKRTIWTDNAQADYWKPKATFDGDLGRVYGVQWRKWRTPIVGQDGIVTSFKEVDQLADLIAGLKKDPYGRRHILTAWNPGELDQMALPPCHVMSEFYVSENKLSCLLTQRSVDCGLGLPYNILSYSILTHMLAQVCGYEVGEFVHSMGDTHIYHNHIDAIREQLTREPLLAPTFHIDSEIKNIDDFTMDSFELRNYNHCSSIHMPMAV